MKKYSYKVEMKPEVFLRYARKVIESCVHPQQAQVAYLFLLKRIPSMKFGPLDEDRVRDIIHFLFTEKADEISRPVSSMWYDAGK